jgi:hypothetical protein
VVSDLEEVDRRKQAALEQRRLDRRLGVAGEQRAEPAVAEHHHDRPVVDVALRQRRGRIGPCRVDDID